MNTTEALRGLLEAVDTDDGSPERTRQSLDAWDAARAALREAEETESVSDMVEKHGLTPPTAEQQQERIDRETGKRIAEETEGEGANTEPGGATLAGKQSRKKPDHSRGCGSAGDDGGETSDVPGVRQRAEPSSSSPEPLEADHPSWKGLVNAWRARCNHFKAECERLRGEREGVKSIPAVMHATKAELPALGWDLDTDPCDIVQGYIDSWPAGVSHTQDTKRHAAVTILAALRSEREGQPPLASEDAALHAESRETMRLIEEKLDPAPRAPVFGTKEWDDHMANAPRAPLGDEVGTNATLEDGINALSEVMKRDRYALRISIPAQETDDDIRISKALHAATTEIAALRAQLRDAGNWRSSCQEAMEHIGLKSDHVLLAPAVKKLMAQLRERPTRERYAAIEAENAMLKKKLNWDPIVDDSIDHLVTRDEALEAMRETFAWGTLCSNEARPAVEALHRILAAVLAKRKEKQ